MSVSSLASRPRLLAPPRNARPTTANGRKGPRAFTWATLLWYYAIQCTARIMRLKLITFDEQRHERYHGRRQFAHRYPVRPVVPAGVDERFVFGELFPGFRRQLVPSSRQPANSHVAQAHQDGEESVEIVILLAANVEDNKLLHNIITYFIISRNRKL